jgi:hypothetical protein
MKTSNERRDPVKHKTPPGLLPPRGYDFAGDSGRLTAWTDLTILLVSGSIQVASVRFGHGLEFSAPQINRREVLP